MNDQQLLLNNSKYLKEAHKRKKVIEQELLKLESKQFPLSEIIATYEKEGYRPIESSLYNSIENLLKDTKKSLEKYINDLESNMF